VFLEKHNQGTLGVKHDCIQMYEYIVPHYKQWDGVALLVSFLSANEVSSILCQNL
jgi:hypothetical protein